MQSSTFPRRSSSALVDEDLIVSEMHLLEKLLYLHQKLRLKSIDMN